MLNREFGAELSNSRRPPIRFLARQGMSRHVSYDHLTLSARPANEGRTAMGPQNSRALTSDLTTRPQGSVVTGCRFYTTTCADLARARKGGI